MSDAKLLNAIKVLEDLDNSLGSVNQWCKGAYALRLTDDQFYAFTEPLNQDACCWCLVGAVRKFAHDDIDLEQDAMKLLYAVFKTDPLYKKYLSVVNFNDHHETKFEDVKEFVKKSIDNAKNYYTFDAVPELRGGTSDE